MQLPERKRNILKKIVESYIATAEPVGSKAVAMEIGGLSSATIRNEMSELEEMGLLEKPHISAGRVPSSLAYRLYVDQIMEQYHSTAAEIEALQRALSQKVNELDNVVENASKIIAEITNYAGISFVKRRNAPVFSQIRLIPLEKSYSYILVGVTTSTQVKNKIINLDSCISDSDVQTFVTSINRLLKERSSPEVFNAVAGIMSPNDPIHPLALKVFEFICSSNEQSHDDLYVDGAAKLLSHPEFHDTDKALKLLSFFSDSGNVSQIVSPVSSNMVNIKIAPETTSGTLSDTAFIFTTYEMGDDIQGVIGVVGPARMDYAATAAKLEIFAKTLGKYFPISFEHKKEDLPEEK